MKLLSIFKRKKPIKGIKTEFEPMKIPNGRIISVDIERTTKYYADKDNKDSCNCGPCLVYYAKIKELYPTLDEFLTKLGVDISKPFEAVSLGLGDEKSYEEYFTWYIVFGTSDIDYSEKVGDLKVYRQLSHPNTQLNEEHFVLEVSMIKIE